MRVQEIELTSLDGSSLVGFEVEPDGVAVASALLVHGINSERTESGFYSLVAERLAGLGIRSVSIDLRGHGGSAGSDSDFTIAGALTDLCAASAYLRKYDVPLRMVVGASFGGGLALYLANELMEEKPSHVVLFNPRINYRPWVEESTLYGEDGRPSSDGQVALAEHGYVERRGFRLSRCMINELATFNCRPSLLTLDASILVLHGTQDSVIPIDSARSLIESLSNATFVPVQGAEHGFTDAETDDPSSALSQDIRQKVASNVEAWIRSSELGNAG